MQSRQEVGAPPIIPGCDSTLLFQLVECSLDQVQFPVVFPRVLVVGLGRDDRFGPLVSDEGQHPVALIPLVGVTKAVEAEPIDLTIDRPFIILIRHRATGAVLFVGRVVEP